MSFAEWLPSPSEILNHPLSTLYSMVMTPQIRTEGQAIIPHSRFGIDNTTGFLLREPLKCLPPAFEFWEQALSDAENTISLAKDTSSRALAMRREGELWRQRLRAGPVLSTRILEGNEAHLQRAHLVLAFLVQYYVHSLPEAETNPPIVPKTLSVPLVAVSKHLGIAPILTYADTVVWNFVPKNPERPLGWDNMGFKHLFSGTEDEWNFYATSAGTELRAAELLRIIEEYHSLSSMKGEGAISKVAKMLDRVEIIIGDMTAILQAVRAGCEPRVFHDAIRPWYKGSDAAGPTSVGWVYEGILDSDKLDLSGASAGQTPAMHALDIWLDIDHKLSQKRLPVPSEQNKRAELGFMERMRRYMPETHQTFLRHLANSPRPLRELAQANPQLRGHYNKAVLALKKFRDVHIRVVTLYIVTMASGIGQESSGQQHCGTARGTGGTEVALLLKAGRDATKRATLE